MRIVEQMSRTDDEWTVKELARAMSTSTTKLYYHVNLLEERELIRTSSSRIVSGIVEKRYRVAARSFRIDRRLISPSAGDAGSEALAAIVSNAFETTRSEIEEGLRLGAVSVDEAAPPERRMTLSRSVCRLTPDRARELQRRMSALTDEFSEDEGAADATPYGLLVGFYPIAGQTPRPSRGTRRRAATSAAAPSQERCSR